MSINDEEFAAKLQFDELKMEEKRLETLLKSHVGTMEKQTLIQALESVRSQRRTLTESFQHLKRREPTEGFSEQKSSSPFKQQKMNSLVGQEKLVIEIKHPKKTIRYRLYANQTFRAALEHFSKELKQSVDQMVFRLDQSPNIRVYSHHCPSDLNMTAISGMHKINAFLIGVDSYREPHKEIINLVDTSSSSSSSNTSNATSPSSTGTINRMMELMGKQKENFEPEIQITGMKQPQQSIPSQCGSSERFTLTINRPFAQIPSKAMRFSIGKDAPLKKLIQTYCMRSSLNIWSIVVEWNNKHIDIDQSCIQLQIPDGSILNVYYGDEYSVKLARHVQQRQESYSTTRSNVDPVWTETEVQEKLERLLEHFNVEIPPTDRMDPPETMSVQELKEYQRIGLTWMTRMERASQQKGGILSDEMGLGKTVQMIATILANPPENNPTSSKFVQQRKRLRHNTLIVLPMSLMEQWRLEIEKFVSTSACFKVLSYHSDFLSSSEKKKYEMNPKLLLENDIVLTTYQTLTNMFGFDKNKRRQYTMGTFEIDPDEVGPLFKVKWYRCVLDEAHVIKNRTAQCSVAASYIRAERRWCLTGTPIQNTSDDLYSLFRFLKLEPYCSWQRFQQDLSISPSKTIREKSNLTTEDRMKKLQAVLQCCLLRRTKNSRIDNSDQPIISLPPKSIRHEQPQFSDQERQVYKAFEERNLKKFNQMIHELEKHFQNILVMIMRMRQMCLHHYLVTDGKDLITGMVTDKELIEQLLGQLSPEPKRRLKEVVENNVPISECPICLDPPNEPVSTLCGHIYCAECILNHVETGSNQCPNCRTSMSRENLIPFKSVQDYFNPDGQLENDDEEEADASEETSSEMFRSTKIKHILSILSDIRKTNPGEKTIIFCSFAKMFDLIRVPLAQEGFNHVRLDGKMKIAERMESVNSFTYNENVTVMLASLRCASVGLNLTAANRVIILDVWWNPALENQAIDRVHRIGQLAKEVVVYKITIPGTIEDRILELQKRKQAIADGVLSDGTNGATPQRLSRNDIIYLFRGTR